MADADRSRTAPLDLPALRALDAKATCGPWTLDSQRDDEVGTWINIEAWHAPCGEPLTIAEAMSSRPNADLVVALRNIAPAMIEEIEALRGEVGGQRLRAEAAFDCHGGPGTTTPGCGACVSCCLRRAEAAEAEVARLSAVLNTFQGEYDANNRFHREHLDRWVARFQAAEAEVQRLTQERDADRAALQSCREAAALAGGMNAALHGAEVPEGARSFTLVRWCQDIRRLMIAAADVRTAFVGGPTVRSFTQSEGAALDALVGALVNAHPTQSDLSALAPSSDTKEQGHG